MKRLSIASCWQDGQHLNSCDDDGFCNNCGYQDVPELFYAVWESDSNGRDWPTYYTEDQYNEAMAHYQDSKSEQPEYVSIRKAWIIGWNTDECDCVEEDTIESYYAEDDEDFDN